MTLLHGDFASCYSLFCWWAFVPEDIHSCIGGSDAVHFCNSILVASTGAQQLIESAWWVNLVLFIIYGMSVTK